MPDSNYEAEPGSVIVKLQPTYLETLSVGEHIITALFNDGNDPSAKFTIKEPTDSSGDEPGDEPGDKPGDEQKDSKSDSQNAPNSGDESNTILWLIVLGVSLAGIGVTNKYYRKRN